MHIDSVKISCIDIGDSYTELINPKQNLQTKAKTGA